MPGDAEGLEVVVTAVDPDAKIRAIKTAREVTGAGLAETKRRIEALPWVIRTGLQQEEADALRAKLAGAGMTVEVRNP